MHLYIIFNVKMYSMKFTSVLVRSITSTSQANVSYVTKRFSSSVKPDINNNLTLEVPKYFLFNENFTDIEKKATFINDMKIYDDFVTPQEEKSIFDEVEPYLKRLRYESYHWDNAIKGYRETEKFQWNPANKLILDKVKKLAFESGTAPLKYIHVLDLKADGVIKPHVDSVKFCGSTIAGLSLLSDSVMRLRYEKQRDIFVDVLLKRRSLYIMSASARYDYTHEILAGAQSVFGSEIIIKSRRVSVICRNEP